MFSLNFDIPCQIRRLKQDFRKFLCIERGNKCIEMLLTDMIPTYIVFWRRKINQKYFCKKSQYPPLIWLGNFFIFWHIPQAASYHGVLPSYQGHYKDMSWKRRQKRKKGGIDPWVIWDMSHWLITPSRKYNGKLGWPLQRTQPLKV